MFCVQPLLARSRCDLQGRMRRVNFAWHVLMSGWACSTVQVLNGHFKFWGGTRPEFV